MNELENLKIGDWVIISGTYRKDKIATVDNITRRYIDVAGTKYSKINGFECSFSYGSTRIHPATEEDVKRIKEQNRKDMYARFLKGRDWNSYPIEVLEKVIEVINDNSATKQ